eukprot:gnl/Trimastix_PCT/1742.p1 GENE.gnl/Trimastix_PCT/1742~~gnl/Trimastix_PCT/1742.p1  ORF type:complete len:244 (+),score=33.72 gnl/Trimastix_PCT/1742:77-808(+)
MQPAMMVQTAPAQLPPDVPPKKDDTLGTDGEMIMGFLLTCFFWFFGLCIAPCLSTKKACMYGAIAGFGVPFMVIGGLAALICFPFALTYGIVRAGSPAFVITLIIFFVGLAFVGIGLAFLVFGLKKYYGISKEINRRARIRREVDTQQRAAMAPVMYVQPGQGMLAVQPGQMYGSNGQPQFVLVPAQPMPGATGMPQMAQMPQAQLPQAQMPQALAQPYHAPPGTYAMQSAPPDYSLPAEKIA